MLAGAIIAWNRQEPFLSEDEVRAVTIAGHALDEVALGTPVVFLVNEADDSVTFLATRAGNVIRAALPPERIRDVVVVVPALDGAAGAERRALERLTAADLAAAEERSGRAAVTIALEPFDAIDQPEDANHDRIGRRRLGRRGPAPAVVAGGDRVRRARGARRARARRLRMGARGGRRRRDRGRPRAGVRRRSPGARGDRARAVWVSRSRASPGRPRSQRSPAVVGTSCVSSSSDAPERLRRHRSASSQIVRPITTGVTT